MHPKRTKWQSDWRCFALLRFTKFSMCPTYTDAIAATWIAFLIIQSDRSLDNSFVIFLSSSSVRAACSQNDFRWYRNAYASGGWLDHGSHDGCFVLSKASRWYRTHTRGNGNYPKVMGTGAPKVPFSVSTKRLIGERFVALCTRVYPLIFRRRRHILFPFLPFLIVEKSPVNRSPTLP